MPPLLGFCFLSLFLLRDLPVKPDMLLYLRYSVRDLLATFQLPADRAQGKRDLFDLGAHVLAVTLTAVQLAPGKNKRVKDFRDLICPDSISFKRNHFEFGDKFGRVLFLRTYASFLTDDLISDLTEYSRNLILSIDMIPVPTDEAVKEVESIILGVETDITRWQQRQNSKNNFTAEVPRTMEQKRENSRGFMDDLTENDQRMIFSLITIVHTADSMEELDADTESLIAIGKEHLCDISPARFQQEDGLNTALPYGLRRIHALNTLTTESCAVAIPFRAQEIQDPSGLSYGINEVSKNPIVCDRKLLSSPHAFYLGISGSGKSMGMKSTIMNVALGTDDDIIIVDAEREYGTLARAFGGEVVEISPNSNHHLNPLEIPAGYEDENPVAQKSELIMSILEQQMGTGSISGSYRYPTERPAPPPSVLCL